MADTNYPIPEQPVYNPNIRALQDSDPARASTIFNPLFERLIENTHAVKKAAEAAQAAAEEAGESAGNAISNDQIGVPGGVASLGKDGKVPKEQLPTLDYIPTTEKGQAGGVATLGEDGKLVQDVDGGTWDTEPVEAHNGAAPAAHTGVAASASQLGHVKPGAEFKVGGDGSLSLNTVDGGTFE